MPQQGDTGDETANELLERAYGLKDSAESKALYREWATTYDQTMLEGLGYLTPKKTAGLLADHVADKTAPILDVGSGTGLAGLELAGLGYTHLDALDYSPEMLAVAKSRDVYQKLIEADLNQPLELPGNAYDAIICPGTFTHAHVGANALHELFRVLKPGGVFACTVHKDIWKPEGFDEVSARMVTAGTIITFLREPGTYYRDSTEPEGWFIVWQKT